MKIALLGMRVREKWELLAHEDIAQAAAPHILCTANDPLAVHRPHDTDSPARPDIRGHLQGGLAEARIRGLHAHVAQQQLDQVGPLDPRQLNGRHLGQRQSCRMPSRRLLHRNSMTTHNEGSASPQAGNLLALQRCESPFALENMRAVAHAPQVWTANLLP